jgi:integrase
MSDAEIAQIRAALAAKEAKKPLPQRWMSICFEVGILQGCRLSETSVPLDHIDEQARTIRFRGKGKNGVPHIFTTRLHEGLLPILAELRAAGVTHTCRLPPRASLEWWEFFRAHGLGHLCFHCTRVTVITRLARAGVPIQQAMRYVGHASETVHGIYQRLHAPDLGSATAALAGLEGRRG